MKLIRFGDHGKEKPGLLLKDGSRIDASAFGADYDEKFFADGGLSKLDSWLRINSAVAPRIPLSVRLGSPICRPSKIVCIGLNYRDHAAETKAETPKEPVLFFKATTSLVGPNDDLVIPKNATKVDWEVELAVVIGKKASYVSKEQALDHVAGYALHNDYSERSFQLERGGQWVKGKSADTFAPLGPFLATPEEILDAGNLSMWLKVNGNILQKSSTSNMIFDVRHIGLLCEPVHDAAPRGRDQHRNTRGRWPGNESACLSSRRRCGGTGNCGLGGITATGCGLQIAVEDAAS